MTEVGIEQTSHIDRLIDESMLAWRQPGLAVCITNARQVVYSKGFGVRRQGERAAVDADTIFSIGSCTKPFAAATVALLVDEGRLDWDDRVVDHLPDLRLYDEAVTQEVRIRDLLCMRTGISSGEHRHRFLCRDRRDYLRRLRYHAPLHPFRAQYSYWTDGYTVLAELVLATTGERWTEFARDRLWCPLGMRRTNADHRIAREDANSTAPHELIDGRVTPIPWMYEDHVARAAGGMNAPVSDLVPWLQLMIGGGQWKGKQLISAVSMREMHNPHTPIRGEYAEAEFASVVGEGPTGIRFASYALGWYVHDYRGHTVIYHTGKRDGFRSIMGFLPDHAIGIAVLINSSNYLMQVGVFQSLLDLLLGIDGADWSREFLRQKVRQDLSLREVEQRELEARAHGTTPSFSLEECEGDYVDGGCYGMVSIRIDDGRLNVTAGTAGFTLQHWQYDVFEVHRQWPYVLGRECLARFISDESGRATGMYWSNGAEFRKVQ